MGEGREQESGDRWKKERIQEKWDGSEEKGKEAEKVTANITGLGFTLFETGDGLGYSCQPFFLSVLMDENCTADETVPCIFLQFSGD